MDQPLRGRERDGGGSDQTKFVPTGVVEEYADELSRETKERREAFGDGDAQFIQQRRHG